MRKSLVILSFLFATGVFAAEDVGLINHLAGDASYVSGAASRAMATAYMKVREGDRFTLAPGAELRLLYFQGGRQESFTGPARFTAGTRASVVESGAQPRVASLPVGVPQRIARVPELLQNAKLGGVQLRGLPPAKADDADLREARSLYERLRKELPRNDITPELFLVSALSEYHRYDDMRPVVDEMLRKQPDNEEAKALAAWVRSQPQRVK